MTLARVPTELADPGFRLPLPPDFALPSDGGDLVVEYPAGVFRLHTPGAVRELLAVVLPLDRLFDARVAAALRLWRHLADRPLGADPAAFSRPYARKLVLALRAFDGRGENASYRDIASALFGEPSVSARPWKTHDLRGRTIRLLQLGRLMTLGGYRRLLLHPSGRRSSRRA
jgi:hypothetical protein